MKDYIKNFGDKAERRFFAQMPELRAASESREVEGLGIVYNSLSENFAPWQDGGLYELIEPGAARGLLDDEDIMILFNHSPDLVLARNKNTAELTDTDEGVRYRYTSPNTSTGNDLLENLRLKNVRKSSFAFMMEEKNVRMERNVTFGDMGKINIRRIVKFERLFDFSPVTYPAYNNTEVMARAYTQEFQKEAIEKENQAKAYLIEVEQKKHELFKLKK
jgi:HK97 family phage prohead protease